MTAFALVFLLVLLGYSFFMLLCFLSLLTAPGSRTSAHPANQAAQTSPGFVSLVLPFRNEENALGLLLDDLLDQDLPASSFEVILVDDHSEDRSMELAESYVQSHSHIHVLRLPEGSEGKKEALGLGIQKASASWILQLDADVRVGTGFVRSYLEHPEQQLADLIAGPVCTSGAAGGLAGSLGSLEQMALTGVGAASFLWGRPLMCSGANLAYARELYHETRSYDPAELSSGDDMFIMIGARKLGRRLRFNFSEAALVRSLSPPSFSGLLNQRIRWAAKSRKYRMPDIQMLALWVALSNLLMLLFPWALLNDPAHWKLFLAGSGLKLISDFLLLWVTAKWCRQFRLLWFFLPAQFIYYPYFFLVFLGVLFGRTKWKAR